MKLNNLKYPYTIFQRWVIQCSILLLGTLGGCVSDGNNRVGTESTCLDQQLSGNQELPPEAFENADDVLTVDCLLPGELIAFGRHTHIMTPPRPAIISAWQCKVYGGQYSLNRNLDGRTMALNVWRQCASSGDKVAENYMGEIYGRSWGQIKPDYVQAAQWYRKAAEKGYSRAQNNLGFLYEHGFGVPKNKQSALQLYRKAMGAVDPITLDQTKKSEINELESSLDLAVQTTNTLKNQLRESEDIAKQQQIRINSLNNMLGNATDIQTQLRNVQKDLEQTRRRERLLKDQLSDLQPKITTLRGQLGKTETEVALKDIPDMGKYYALIIGINDYQPPLVTLDTPVNDAKRVEKVLRQKYGFETTLLVDDGAIKPTRKAIYKALEKFRRKIKEGDNFLIYFAGHGDLESNQANWLPYGAHYVDEGNWLSTNDITKKIAFRGDAKSLKARHVLVIADSCYSAAMATSWLEPSEGQVVASLANDLVTRSRHTEQISSGYISPFLAIQPDGLSAEGRIGWIRNKYKSKSRKELTSGGIEPVLDQATRNGLSVFANAFTKMLETNNGIIGTYEIYARIGPQVTEQVRLMGMDQTPVYAPIPQTGDNHGEFFFVPR